jgi:hypothetical protein
MVKLYLSDAIALIRKNLDEVEPNGSVMYEDEGIDNLSLDDIIAKHLPEAINAVHLSAPVQLLEGKPYESSDLVSVSITDGILSVALKTDTNYLRLVTFQAADSYIVVTDVLAKHPRKAANNSILTFADGQIVRGWYLCRDVTPALCSNTTRSRTVQPMRTIRRAPFLA